MTIASGQHYVSRGGHRIRVYHIDPEYGFIHGAILIYKKWIVGEWLKDGKFETGREHDFDFTEPWPGDKDEELNP